MSGSFDARPHRAGGGEPLYFPSEVRVLGRAAGHGAPRKAIVGLISTLTAALGYPGAGVTLCLVSPARSLVLNRDFRGEDHATDVISFPAQEGLVPEGFSGYLGDLAFCPQIAWERKGRFEKDFGGEAAFLVLHGLLHLSGRHHDTPAQERALWRLSARLHPASVPFRSELGRLAPTPQR